MKKIYILLALLLALSVPWAVNAQQQCSISYELTDSYGDGWNGGSLVITDATTSTQLADLTISSGSSLTGTITVIVNHELSFQYTPGGYPGENSWVITDVNGEVIWEGEGSGGDQSYTYTVVCPSCLPPTSPTVTLTQGNGTIADLSWTAGGSETEWRVEYATNSDFTGAQTKSVYYSPSTQLTGLTAETTYYARVIAVCGGQDGESTPTNTVSFTPTNFYFVTVSEGTSTNSYAPLYGNYKSSYDQMIYTASQLEDAGISVSCNITKIGFNSITANTEARNPVIYICQTDKNAFSDKNDFVSINEFTKVYDFNDHSQWNITAGWNEFVLDTPFEYDGTSNLIIAMHCGLISGYANTYFYASTVSDYQVIYAYNDNTDPNPATYEGNWSNYPSNNSTTNKNISTVLPVLKLYYEPVTVACAKPTGLAIVGSPTAHGVTVQWNAEVGETFDYAIELGTGIDPETVTYAGSITSTGTTCSMSWNNLTNGDSDYTVFIRKNCSNGSYSTAATKIIHTAIACPAPTTLACTAVTANTATLSWTENAGASAWQICLNGDETAPTDINTNTEGVTVSEGTVTYVLPNLTAETVYTAKVRTVCGGIDGESDWSTTVSFEPTIKQLITGETTGTASYLPFNNYYKYSYTQQIYTIAELGTPGLIESIDFYKTADKEAERDLVIYMVNTDKSSFEGTTDFITVTDADIVYTGTKNFAYNAWTTITLDEPFIYNGTQNVAIIVDDNTGDDASSGTNFLTFTASATQSHYYYQDASDIDPASPSANSNNITTSKNQIRILKSELSSCMKPTGLSAGTPGSHSVELNWTENGEAEAWVISYNGTTVDVTTNPSYTLTGLTPETEYTVKVRPDCDENLWSNEITFTTDVACPAPTLQPLSGISNNTATISWTGSEAGNFNVRYRAIDTVYFESFEDGLPSGWTTIDNDGDGYNWLVSTEVGSFASHSGSVCMTSASYDNNAGALTPDNWLITPLLDLQGTMKVWLRGQDESVEYDANKEHFAIYLSTTGTTVEDFTVTLVPEAITTKVYTEYTADLTGYVGQQGYIAIRHFNITDQFYLDVDDFGIYDVDEWQTPDDSPVSASTITLTDLDAETVYEVEVQADCGNGDGTSVWVGTTFTTLDNCALPYELNVTDLTANSATLNWTGSQDSYNVRYRELTYGETFTATEDFEHDGDLPEGWMMLDLGDGSNSAELGISTDAAQNGTYGFRFSSYEGSSSGSFDQYLISPELPNLNALSFAFKSSNGSYDVFRVGYSTTTNDVSAFTWGDETSSEFSWTTYTEDIENIPANAKYFAINYTAVWRYRLYIDDITYTCTPITAGAWNETNTEVTNGLDISGLEPETTYEWQVQGIDCNGEGTNTDWSESAIFTTDCGRITLNHDGMWFQNFDELTTSTEKWTGKTMNDCWTWTRLVELPEGYLDTVPQIYYNSDFSYSDPYSLRLHFRGIYAMPEIDESININYLKMSMYLRQSYPFYTLLVGVMDDPSDPETFKPVAHLDNGTSTSPEYVEVSFANYQGDGRYIAFKNVRPSATAFDGQWADIYSVNYIDNLTLAVMEDPQPCVVGLPYVMSFEDVTPSTNALTGAMPECWEMVQNDLDEEIPFEKMPQVYCKATLANSGNYSLRMANRCVYAMPQLADNVDMSRVQLSMSVRQPNARYQLYVGVWAEGEFHPVALVNNASTSHELFECDFSNYDGPAGRIAFRNVLSSGKALDYSYNYIDDITLYYDSTYLTPEYCDITLDDLPYQLDFEENTSNTDDLGVALECWKLISTDPGVVQSPATKPQLYHRDDNYSLRMVNRCVYAMPTLAFSSENLELTFDLIQPRSVYLLEVGLVDNSGNFEVVKVINNGIQGSQQVKVYFRNLDVEGKRIAFHNILAGSLSYDYSYNYIDNIRLQETTPLYCERDLAEYEEDFEGEAFDLVPLGLTGVQPECWEMFPLEDEDIDLSYTKMPQVYFSGENMNKSLKMINRCVYAMPIHGAQSDYSLTDLAISFDLLQPRTFYLLEVGVVDEDGNFEVLEEINNPTTDVTPVTVSFDQYTGNGTRVAFRNTLRGCANYDYSYNYIDNIHFLVTDDANNEANKATEDVNAFDVDRYLNNIAVYPNPTLGELHIGAVDVQNVECYNQMGQLVAVYDNENNINISSLSQGVYTLRITVPQGVTMRKVVKR